MLLNWVDSIYKNKNKKKDVTCNFQFYVFVDVLTLIADKYPPTSLITTRENSFGKAGVSRRGTL